MFDLEPIKPDLLFPWNIENGSQSYLKLPDFAVHVNVWRHIEHFYNIHFHRYDSKIDHYRLNDYSKIPDEFKGYHVLECSLREREDINVEARLEKGWLWNSYMDDNGDIEGYKLTLVLDCPKARA
jgi:hypothetical protein